MIMNKNHSRIALLSLAGSLLLSSPVPGGALDAKAEKDRITDAVASTGWTNGPVASIQAPAVRQSMATTQPVVTGKFNRSSFEALAAAACLAPIDQNPSKGYFLKYLLGEQALSRPFRWGAQDNYTRGLGISADQCSADGKLVGEGQHQFILAYGISTEKGKAEGYYYLTSTAGGIIKVDHTSDHAAASHILENPDDPVVVADFNAAVDYWLKLVAKYQPQLLQAQAQPPATQPGEVVKN